MEHPLAEICRKAGISQATYFNWKKQYVGLASNQVRELKQVVEENALSRRSSLI